MNSIIFGIGITIILIFILIIYVIRFKTKSNILNNNYTYDYLRNVLKTGDIILFESMENGSLYGNIKHFVISSVVGIKFKHSGIVLKHNNELYLLECCRYTQAGYAYATYINKDNDLVENVDAKPGGVRIIKLDDIIREYTKEYRGKFCVKFINKEIPNYKLLKAFEKYTYVKFGDLNKVLFKGLLDIFLPFNMEESSEFKDSMICSEFTHRLLLDCGIIKNNISSSVFWPFYYYNGIFDNLAIVKYSNPICFNYS
jgi:hypothetical protein